MANLEDDSGNLRVVEKAGLANRDRGSSNHQWTETIHPVKDDIHERRGIAVSQKLSADGNALPDSPTPIRSKIPRPHRLRGIGSDLSERGGSAED